MGQIVRGFTSKKKSVLFVLTAPGKSVLLSFVRGKTETKTDRQTNRQNEKQLHPRNSRHAQCAYLRRIHPPRS